MTRNILFIHYWKLTVSDEELQLWLDKMVIWSKKNWLILLDEKLRRVENEVSIK